MNVLNNCFHLSKLLANFTVALQKARSESIAAQWVFMRCFVTICSIFSELMVPVIPNWPHSSHHFHRQDYCFVQQREWNMQPYNLMPVISSFELMQEWAIIPASSSVLFFVANLKTAFELSPNKTFLLDACKANKWAESHLALLASPNPLSQLISSTWMDLATGKFSPSSFCIDHGIGVAIMLNQNFYLHCNMGGRANKWAGHLLNQMGYQGIVVLEEVNL